MLVLRAQSIKAKTQVSNGKTSSPKSSLNFKSVEASPSQVASHKILELESTTLVVTLVSCGIFILSPVLSICNGYSMSHLTAKFWHDDISARSSFTVSLYNTCRNSPDLLVYSDENQFKLWHYYGWDVVAGLVLKEDILFYTDTLKRLHQNPTFLMHFVSSAIPNSKKRAGELDIQKTDLCKRNDRVKTPENYKRWATSKSGFDSRTIIALVCCYWAYELPFYNSCKTLPLNSRRLKFKCNLFSSYLFQRGKARRGISQDYSSPVVFKKHF